MTWVTNFIQKFHLLQLERLPNWIGSPRRGVRTITSHLQIRRRCLCFIIHSIYIYAWALSTAFIVSVAHDAFTMHCKNVGQRLAQWACKKKQNFGEFCQIQNKHFYWIHVQIQFLFYKKDKSLFFQIQLNVIEAFLKKVTSSLKDGSEPTCESHFAFQAFPHYEIQTNQMV